MSVDINWAILTSSSTSPTTTTTATTTSSSTNTSNPSRKSSEAPDTKTLTTPTTPTTPTAEEKGKGKGSNEHQDQEGDSLADSVRDFLDARFQQITLPPFLRAVHVTAFDFGDAPPEVEVRDVCEPLGEFYEEDTEEDTERDTDGSDGADRSCRDGGCSDDDGDGGEDTKETTEEKDWPGRSGGMGTEIVVNAGNGKVGSANGIVAAGEGGGGITTAAINRLNLRNLGLPVASSMGASVGASLPSPFYDFHFAGAGALNTPQLSVAGTHTPGIPGGTSNLGYFHLPLSAGLSGAGTGAGAGTGSGTGTGSVATTPLMAATGMSKGVSASTVMSQQGRRENHEAYHKSLRQHQRRQNQGPGSERGNAGGRASPVEPYGTYDGFKRKEQRRANQRSKGGRMGISRRRDGTTEMMPREDRSRYSRQINSCSGSSSSSNNNNSYRDSGSDDDSVDSTHRVRVRRRQRQRQRQHRNRDSYGSISSISSASISASASASASLIPGPQKPSPNDIQVVTRVRYSGNVRVSLTADIILDYPMQSFVGIPLKLNITGLVFDGTAVLAYIHQSRKENGRQDRKSRRGSNGRSGNRRGRDDEKNIDGEEEKDGKRVHFCFLAHEDAHALYRATDADITSDLASTPATESDHKTHKTTLNPNDEKASTAVNASPVFTATVRDNNSTIQVEANDNNSLLRALRIESEIGQGENGKQVLKNVGKVERFVLEQVRRVFEEELVFPSYWTFLV